MSTMIVMKKMKDQSETSVKPNAINKIGQSAMKSNDGKALFRNDEKGRSDGRRARNSDFDGITPSRRESSDGRRARNSDFDVTTPSINAERGRSDRRRARNSDFDGITPSRRESSDGRRARNSDFDVTTPSRNAERGRSDRRKARKSDFDMREPSSNSERGIAGRQHSSKSGDAVFLEASRGRETHLGHNIHQISRGRLNFSQSKGRLLLEKKASA